MLFAQPATIEAGVLSFARLLRGHGFLVGAGEAALGLLALTAVDLRDREDVRLAWRGIFAASQRQQQQFDVLFDLYWREGFLHAVAEEVPPPTEPETLAAAATPQLAAWAASRSDADEETLGIMSYSPTKLLAGRDFSAIDGDEIEALSRLVARLARKLASRYARRYRSSHNYGKRLDPRRTIRRSLGRGGEPLELSFKKRRIERTRLLFLFDVSGSMTLYSRFLLQLAFAFVRQRSLGRSEVFGFGTDLYRLTDTLKRQGVREALRRALAAMPGRAGGTRIGASLHALLEGYGVTIDRHTVVIIASDGWDTGDLELLRLTMRNLARRSRRIIWLNPLAGHPGYLPTASGMQAALPAIDILAPAHNLESLRALEGYLGESR